MTHHQKLYAVLKEMGVPGREGRNVEPGQMERRYVEDETDEGKPIHECLILGTKIHGSDQPLEGVFEFEFDNEGKLLQFCTVIL